MNYDKMRQEFEKWAESKYMSLTRIHWASGSVSDYAYTATFDAWKVWQAAYQAGRKAEREAIVQTIRTVRGSLAWQSKISFAALAELIEHKPEGDDERG